MNRWISLFIRGIFFSQDGVNLGVSICWEKETYSSHRLGTKPPGSEHHKQCRWRGSVQEFSCSFVMPVWTDSYIHTYPYTHTHTHTHIIYGHSHGSVWAHTKFNFDLQLSDNYHLRFFWNNELCWSVSRLHWLNQHECCSTSSTSSWCKSTHFYIYKSSYLYSYSR
jgi:hypothetical protein